MLGCVYCNPVCSVFTAYLPYLRTYRNERYMLLSNRRLAANSHFPTRLWNPTHALRVRLRLSASTLLTPHPTLLSETLGSAAVRPSEARIASLARPSLPTASFWSQSRNIRIQFTPYPAPPLASSPGLQFFPSDPFANEDSSTSSGASEREHEHGQKVLHIRRIELLRRREWLHRVVALVDGMSTTVSPSSMPLTPFYSPVPQPAAPAHIHVPAASSPHISTVTFPYPIITPHSQSLNLFSEAAPDQVNNISSDNPN